jgi:hypothetical protein
MPHPNKNGKGLIVDHNLTILFLPMLISGVSFGVLCNIILPEPIIMITLCLLMGYLSYGMYNKASTMRVTENEKLEEEAKEKDADQKQIEMVGIQEKEDNPDEASVAEENEGGSNQVDAEKSGFDDIKEGTKEISPELQEFIDYDSSNLQWSKLILSYSLIGILVVMKLL